MYKRLFIWVEGDDDERFFNKILMPYLKTRYDLIDIVKYAQTKRDKINNFIKSIKDMGADYIYARDINNARCITDKKQHIKDDLTNTDVKNIVIVVKEIESWYLAGLSDRSCKKLGVRFNQATDNIAKEDFNRLVPKKFDRSDFMMEILKCFCFETAKKRNKSFNYFSQKYSILLTHQG